MAEADHDKISLDARYRTMLIIWFAQMMSVIMFFLVTFLSDNSSSQPGHAAPNLLKLVFLGVSVLLVVISFVVRSSILKLSVERQDPLLVQTALVAACALCEAPALLGVVAYFAFSARYFYLFLISLVAMAMHFPRRDSLFAASYQTFSPGEGS